jgi:hypothetical protein
MVDTPQVRQDTGESQQAGIGADAFALIDRLVLLILPDAAFISEFVAPGNTDPKSPGT